MFGLEDAVAGEIHHAIAEGGPKKDANGCNQKNSFIGASFGSNGRIQEVDRIVAHAYIKVQDGQGEEENDDAEIESFHY